MQRKIDNILNATPGILDRWGHDLFVETPLYRSKKKHRPIYINAPLFYKLFKIEEHLSFDEMAELLTMGFSTTIEEEAGTKEVIGTAYVDKQADPLNLSLSGNLGSGRAYYAGKYFNIKGEKTPLATATKKQYSDGYLEMERAVWETVVSNSLQNSISTGVNYVLAIFDMDEYCDVEWREEPVKRGKIIRIDMQGELDRVTHNFYMNTPVTDKALKETATCYGRLEADKFIERLIHGTWSLGNISMKGHLIDLDTVGAVKGRYPAYSSTRWFHENRFGFEHFGQLKILKALADDKKLNVDNTKIEDLNHILLDTRKEYILQGFIKLMGFQGYETDIIQSHVQDISELCDMFLELSQKCTFKDGGLLTKKIDASMLPLYDLSKFMRFYPALKNAEQFTVEEALSLILNDTISQDSFIGIAHDMNDIEQSYIDGVYDVIGNCFVTSYGEYTLLNIGLKSFIKKYDTLFENISKAYKTEPVQLEACAYILNEDRYYLMPYFTASYHIAQDAGQVPSKEIHNNVCNLITANTRIFDPKSNTHITDVRLYDEAMVSTQINASGEYRKIIEIYKPSVLKDPLHREIKFEIDDTTYNGHVENDGYRLIITSDIINMLTLSADQNYENTLLTPRIALYTQYEDNEKLKLKDLVSD